MILNSLISFCLSNDNGFFNAFAFLAFFCIFVRNPGLKDFRMKSNYSSSSLHSLMYAFALEIGSIINYKHISSKYRSEFRITPLIDSLCRNV